MSIHKIKANYVDLDGEYAIIKRAPFTFIWIIVGIVFGFTTGTILQYLLEVPQSHYSYTVIITVISAIAFPLFSINSHEEYIVPKVDIVTIKKYPKQHRVTVVLDDTRTKRQQATVV